MFAWHLIFFPFIPLREYKDLCPHYMVNINGLAQDCGNSSASARELLQSCSKVLISSLMITFGNVRNQDNVALMITLCVNTLRQRQNGRHFPDIFKCIFLNEHV